jgi:hypothetical protein
LSAGFTSTDTGDGSVNDSYYDAWLVKLNAEGAIQWQKAFGGFRADTAYSICFARDGSVVLASSSKSNDGDFGSNHGLTDMWIAKLIDPMDINEQTSIDNISFSPNPASDYIYINVGNWLACSLQEDLKIYNALGECVFTLTPALSKREKELRIDVSQLAVGVYFVSINIGKEVLTGSFMVVR